VVDAILPRSNEITRPDKYGKLKTLAANITQMVVVVAVRPDLSEDLVDRYLVAAESMGVRALVVLNKIDMLEPADQMAALGRLADYVRAGYNVISSVAASAGRDVVALLAALRGQISILVGQSGVGKSSLAGALLGDASIRIGPLALSGKSGTHTTTETTLYRLDDGALIDSPGVREYRLWNLDATAVTQGFREFQPYRGTCRFNDCRHRNEPGCTIVAAVRTGDLSERRWQSYLRIMDALPSKASWQT
jgi:ribosome biogenesis GTPase / thiamine phosphate phosphatase